jgi:hypothetical protein
VNNWSTGGWAVYITEYPDEGLMGPYTTRAEAQAAARTQLPEDETAVVRLSATQCRELQEALWARS